MHMKKRIKEDKQYVTYHAFQIIIFVNMQASIIGFLQHELLLSSVVISGKEKICWVNSIGRHISRGIKWLIKEG